ncbi:MAG: MerR family transcriptional regulator [Bacteroidota bacterium]
MPLEKSDEQLKRYYSIGEVADRFGVKASLIRYWEGEFDFLKPHKNAKGDRRFTRKNIEQIELIYHLVKERGFTLDGAKQEIKQNKKQHQERAQISARLREVRKRLEIIKENF